MDKINNVMSAISDILATQSEDECRRNVFGTICALKLEFPDEEKRIDKCFRDLCDKYNKDFFKDVRIKQ